jgi:hypothetical protein
MFFFKARHGSVLDCGWKAVLVQVAFLILRMDSNIVLSVFSVTSFRVANLEGGRDMKKHILLSATVLTLFGAKAFAVTRPVLAQTNEEGPAHSLAQKIAEKFGLNKDEVMTVVNDHHKEMNTQRQAEMKAKMGERLTQIVTDGKITEAQKQLILAKQSELQSAREAEMQSLKDKTPDERKAAMEKHSSSSIEELLLYSTDGKEKIIKT